MQPVGAPIGRDQGAVAPDRAELLAADALPDGPAGFYIGACEQQLAAFGLHLFGHRRLLPVDFAAHPQRNAETDDQQGAIDAVVGDLEGYLHWLKLDTGDVVGREQVDGAALRGSPHVSADGVLYAISSEGKLSAYRLGN